MAEALGVAASAIEVANLGIKLSSSLYTYIETVSAADRRLKEVATKVELTTAVIQEVGVIFDGPEIVALRKESAVTTARSTLRECSAIFEEIEDAVIKSRKNKFLFPFRIQKLASLSASLESLKSNLSLLLHVLQHAHRIASDAKARKEAEDRIRERDEALAALSRQLAADDDSAKSLPSYDSGVGPGIFLNLHQQSVVPTQPKDDDLKLPNENKRETADQGLTSPDASRQVTAEELESCVSGLKKLIEQIERFQKNMPTVQEPQQDVSTDLHAAYAAVRQTLEDVIPRCSQPAQKTQELVTPAQCNEVETYSHLKYRSFISPPSHMLQQASGALAGPQLGQEPAPAASASWSPDSPRESPGYDKRESFASDLWADRPLPAASYSPTFPAYAAPSGPSVSSAPVARPDTYPDDVDFAASLAAGLSSSGFDLDQATLEWMEDQQPGAEPGLQEELLYTPKERSYSSKKKKKSGKPTPPVPRGEEHLPQFGIDPQPEEQQEALTEMEKTQTAVLNELGSTTAARQPEGLEEMAPEAERRPSDGRLAQESETAAAETRGHRHTVEPDLDEDELGLDIRLLPGSVSRLTELGRAMGQEVDAQQTQIQRVAAKSDRVDDVVVLSRARLERMEGHGRSQPSSRSVGALGSQPMSLNRTRGVGGGEGPFGETVALKSLPGKSDEEDMSAKVDWLLKKWTTVYD